MSLVLLKGLLIVTLVSATAVPKDAVRDEPHTEKRAGESLTKAFVSV